MKKGDFVPRSIWDCLMFLQIRNPVFGDYGKWVGILLILDISCTILMHVRSSTRYFISTRHIYLGKLRLNLMPASTPIGWVHICTYTGTVSGLCMGRITKKMII